MNKLPDYWDGVIERLIGAINGHDDLFVLQTYHDKYLHGPYVQGIREYGNMLSIEATSNRFLEPPIGEHGREVMLFLGWSPPNDSDSPNYSQLLSRTEWTSFEVAALLAQSLHFAYGLDEDTHFELATKMGVG